MRSLVNELEESFLRRRPQRADQPLHISMATSIDHLAFRSAPLFDRVDPSVALVGFNWRQSTIVTAVRDALLQCGFT